MPRSSTFCVLMTAVAMLLLQSADARAQITVSTDDYRARLGQQYQLHTAAARDTVALETLVAADGADRTYDLTALDLQPLTRSVVSYEELPADVPGADLPEFADADHAVGISGGTELTDSQAAAWTFHELRDDGVYSYGLFADVDLSDLDSLSLPDSFDLLDSLDGIIDSLELSDTLRVYLAPQPIRTLALPMTSGDSWSANGQGLFRSGELLLPITISQTAAVDGYGTLITPAGQAPALRLHTTYVLAVPFTDIGVTIRSIEFVTRGDLAARILLDEEEAPVGLTYRSPDEGMATTPPSDHAAVLTLAPPSPHPVAATATIHFTLPAPAHARLRIFDLLGREVATLVDGVRVAGPHAAPFDASALPAGLYVARLEAAGQARTRTIVRVR